MSPSFSARRRKSILSTLYRLNCVAGIPHQFFAIRYLLLPLIHYCTDSYHFFFASFTTVYYAANWLKTMYLHTQRDRPLRTKVLFPPALPVELMSPDCNISASYPKVLPNRTHPLLLMSAGGGYVLSGTTVATNPFKPAGSQWAEEPAPKRLKLTDTEG